MGLPIDHARQTREFHGIRRSHLLDDYDDLVAAVRTARRQIDAALTALAVAAGCPDETVRTRMACIEDDLDAIAGKEWRRIRDAFDDHGGDATLMEWPAP